jgi:peptidoglycan/LPS O-acetylase OafA/YrhL
MVRLKSEVQTIPQPGDRGRWYTFSEKAMTEQPPTSPDVYGHLTGWRRLAIIVLGGVSGAVVALLFSVFSGHPPPAWEIILGALGGALLGLSASLGEARRKKTAAQPPTHPSSGE